MKGAEYAQSVSAENCSKQHVQPEKKKQHVEDGKDKVKIQH